MPHTHPSRRATPVQALHDLAAAIASSLEMTEVTGRAVRAILDVTGLHASFVYLADPAAGVVRCAASAGATPEMLDRYGVMPLDRSTLTGRAILTGIPQISGRTQAAPSTQEVMALLGATQFAILPLRAAGEILGTLNVLGARQRPLGRDLTFLEAAADLLGLALHNARLHTRAERERARARFLADVGQAFADMLDQERVLKEVAARATDILGDWCVLYLLDRRRQILEMRAVHHADPRRTEIVLSAFRNRPVRVGEGVAGNVVLDRRPRIFPRFDEAAIAALASRDDAAYMAELRRVRSWACLPLVARHEAVGALVIATTGDQPFTDDDIALAGAFADRAALAIDNAGLYADAHRRAEEAGFLAETSALVAGADAPDVLLSRLARQAIRLLGDGCGIFLLGQGQQWLPLAVIEHRDASVAERVRRQIVGGGLRLAEGPLGDELRAGRTLIANGPDEVLSYAHTDAGRRFFEEFNIRSLIAVRLGTAEEPLGAIICVRHHPPEYTEDDARLLQLVADRTSAALGNALLHARIAGERARLAGLIEQLPEGVVIAAAPNSRIVLINRAAAAILGRAIQGESLTEHLASYRLSTADGKPYPTADLPLVRALRGEVVRGVEVWSERPDGRGVPLLVSAAPLPGAGARPAEAVAVFQDITAIKEVERQKDEWLSIASHELRTPITSLKGYAQFLERQMRSGRPGVPDQHTLQEAVDTISRQAERLTTIVNDLLDVSRIQQGRLNLRRRPIDLRDIIRTAVVRFTDLAPGSGGRLRLDLPAAPLTGLWDPDRLDQVLTTLLSNAFKFDPGGGPIDVRARRDGVEAIVEVQDMGIGVPEGELPTLFRPFVRAANVRQGFAGVGLGLYIARDIVERHGGRIWVSSREGEGTTVAFALPIETGPEPAPGQAKHKR